MKIEGLPESIQEVAANLLSKVVSDGVIWSAENTKRTTQAIELAKTVRDCFLELYAEPQTLPIGKAGPDSGSGV